MQAGLQQILTGFSFCLGVIYYNSGRCMPDIFDFAMHWQCEIHAGQPLDTICLAPQCQESKVLCFLCKVQSHRDHEPAVPIKIFTDSFLTTKAVQDHFIRETAQIDRLFINIHHKLQKIKNCFLHYGMVEEAFIKFWKQTEQEVMSFSRIVSNLACIMASNDPKAPRELNKWVEQYSDLYLLETEEEEQNNNIYTNFLKQKIASLEGVSQSVEVVAEKPNFDDLEIISLFHMQKSRGHKLKIHFSEDLKGACMTIHSPTKASMTKSGNQRMMLLEPALNTTKSIKRWKVKIEKLASWIGVGISFLDKIKEVNFDFSYTSSNHGNYLISSNGYSWNGYKMEYNSKFEPFSFGTGDIIEITYDPAANKVTFAKQNHDKTFTYDVDPNQKPIHPSVNLTGAGDTVQIIN